MAQRQDLAVDRLQTVERFLKLKRSLGTLSRFAGARVAPQQVSCESRGAGFGQRALVEGDLSTRVAPEHSEMMTVQNRQPLSRDRPQPKKKGNGRIRQVVAQLPGCVQVRILKDIRWIDPTLEAPVHPECDHAAQPLAMLHEQRCPHTLITGCRAAKQAQCFAGVCWFGGLHISLYARCGG
jgi:hypothetical protein